MQYLTSEEFLSENKQTAAAPSNEAALDETVLDIIKHVRTSGDAALYSYTEKLDKVKLNSLTVTEEEIKEAMELVGTEFRTALQTARDNIRSFHQMQKEQSWFTDQQNGIVLGQKVTPLDSAGIYVPGGKAAYPSTVLMNVIPAVIAGVENIVITTPPQADGKINPYVLAAAAEAGVNTIFKVGGAQAIAALAYGTETISKVAKITGPGNAYVARAKKWVYGDVAIDMIAGPSEICVAADETAPANYIAADLLSQAEHDESASSILVTTSKTLAQAVEQEINIQTERLERKSIIEQSLSDNGKIILVEDIEAAMDVVNEIAPEHLEVMTENPMEKLPLIKHAGAIFLGNYSSEPLGDYIAGPNHTLPTSGTAKFASPLGVYDFMKKSSIISYSKTALKSVGQHIQTLANTEGLTAHANAIRIREDDEHA